MPEKKNAQVAGNDLGNEKDLDAALSAVQYAVPKWADAAAKNDALIIETLTEMPQWWWLRVLPRLERDEATGCLLWQGVKDRRGYGRVNLSRAIAPSGRKGGVAVRVHRLAHILHNDGPVPFGQTLDHLCRNRACCEPTHLRALTVAANTLAEGSLALTADHASRTHCPRGHALEGDNLRAVAIARGRRNCKACRDESDALISQAHKALGVTQRRYTAIFGWSRATAERTLDSLARGVRPEVLIAGAEAAIAATERDLAVKP